MTRFIVASVWALVALLGAYVLEGGDLVVLVGISPALVTILVPFFGALAVWSFQDWKRAWSHAFKPGDGARVSVEIWKFLEFASYLSGILGSLVGGVLILGSLEGREMVGIGHSLAAGLVGTTYGTLWGFFARILRVRVENLNAVALKSALGGKS